MEYDGKNNNYGEIRIIIRIINIMSIKIIEMIIENIILIMELNINMIWIKYLI